VKADTCGVCHNYSETTIEIGGVPHCNRCVKQTFSKLTEEEQLETTNLRIYGFMELLKDAPKTQAPQLIWDVWNAILVKGVEVGRGKKENYYTFKLAHGEVVLNELECLNCNKFRMDYQRIYGVLLPNLPATKWSCMLTDWLKKRITTKDVEEISEQQEVIDAILTNITSSRLINGLGESVFGTVYYHDDAVLVPNETIRTLSLKINRNLSLRKVSSIMENYLIGTTKVYRTPSGSTRMWRFSPPAVGVDVEEAITLSDDDGD
jgi:hypothetical protein